MIYAVLDTNILVSAMLNPKSVPGQIIIEALIGKIIPVLNDVIMEEYEEVLERERYRKIWRYLSRFSAGIFFVNKTINFCLTLS